MAEVLLSGSLSRPVIKVGDQVRFWLTARNPNPQSIFEVRLLHLDAPGYQIDRLCWCEGGEGSCWSGLQDSAPYMPTGASHSMGLLSCGPLKHELKPGQSVTVWGDLRGRTPQELQSILAVVGWKTADNRDSEAAVPIGQSVVESGMRRFWRAFRGILKDFALPLVLLGLGFGFQWWDRRRERTRQKQEQRRAHLAETWNLMLPQSHELMTKYYLPLAGAAEGTLEFLARCLTEEEPGASLVAARKAFFHLSYFGRRLREIFYCIGGFHFKSRVGEELAAACLHRYQKLYYGESEDVQRHHSRALNHVELTETFDSFLTKLDGAPGIDTRITEDLKKSRDDFARWVRTPGCREAVLYIKGLGALVEYEMNRPYEHWYGQAERMFLDKDTEEALLSLASDIAQVPEKRSFVDDVRKYLAASKAAVVTLAE